MVQSIDDARRRRGPSGSGRVPPHNLQAEESLLGAMLLNKDAIASAVQVCRAEDFYKPAHGHVFDAVCSLYAQGEPVDPVTVADELRRAGLLDAIGGPSLLTDLQVATPATSNAERYARIVEEHALLRKLIGVAGEIAELGYSLPDDVTAVLDQAESMVFEVADRRVTDSLARLDDLLRQHLDHLEQLYERGEAITGTPTGFHDLDELLSGLQPSALITIGARPAMGKALALDTPIPTPTGWTTMGELRAGDEVFDDQGRPCTVTYTSPVFVDHRCYELRFDDGSTIVADAGHRWFVHHTDGSERVATTEELVALRVHDAAGSPVWSVPAAALDLPDADLATDPYDLGRSCAERAGDRTHRLPASVLRGGFKQRLRALHGLMDIAGAVTGGRAELQLADPWLLEQAWELAVSLGHTPLPLEPAAGGGWRFRWTPPEPVFTDAAKASALATVVSMVDDGRPVRRAIISIEEVASVPTRCISVDAPSHLFLAGRAMIPTHNTAFALGLASHAAIEAQMPVLFFSLEMGHNELTQRLLAAEAKVESTKLRTGKLADQDWTKISHAIGRLSASPLYIDDNPNLTVMEVRAKARRLQSQLGGLGLIVIDYLQLMTGRRTAENRQVEVSEMSRGLKILARELKTPVVALSQLSRNLEMRADKRPVLADLRESGCLTADARVLRADTGAEVTLGELLATGERNVPVWSLDDQMRMVPATMTHAFSSGVKETFELRLASGRTVKASANHPFLRFDGWRRLDELSPGDRLAVVDEVTAPVDRHQHEQARSAAVAVLPRPTTAESNVFWDTVVAVEPLGPKPVFDATVLGTHNFVANGIVVHNSIEQDSDVVMFLYRDEVYNPESPDRGTAEVIVSKHRNGPTGITQLAFLDRFTRFANMARV